MMKTNSLNIDHAVLRQIYYCYHCQQIFHNHWTSGHCPKSSRGKLVRITWLYFFRQTPVTWPAVSRQWFYQWW